LRVPDREGEGEGKRKEEKDDLEESRARIITAAAEFILSRKDCVDEIVIGFVFRQLFIFPG
jgi:hypothetical protein